MLGSTHTTTTKSAAASPAAVAAPSARQPVTRHRAASAQPFGCWISGFRRRTPIEAADQNQQHAANFAASVAASVVLLLSSSCGPAAANPVFEGPARVVDGDTLYIGKDKIRLYGIDAPETKQSCLDRKGRPYACGVVSLQALKERVGNRHVRCEVKNKDQYARNVAACSISPDLPFQQPEDMGQFLVSNGYAVAYRAYGKEYIAIEEQAHNLHKGIWAGDFTEPALWRKQQKATALTASLATSSSSSNGSINQAATQSAAALPSTSSLGAGAGGKPSYAAVAAGSTAVSGSAVLPQQAVSLGAGSCNGPIIKGNITSKGQKIYHTVNSGQYMRVEIDESKGERYFCSEEEARAAGWQAAKK